MKKLINTVLICLLAMMLPVSVFAAQDPIKVNDADALPGETVYLTISVTQPIEASSMGIKYTFDEKVLKVLPKSCSWEVSGMIKDFSKKDNNGVWAAGEPVELKGDVCVLAFEVLSKAKLTQTVVDCTLVVENSGKQEYKASATISARCDHQYGPWSSFSGELHNRQCTLCEKMESQSHQWDEGGEVLRDHKRLQVFTCAVCKGTKEIELGETAATMESTEPREESEHPKETIMPTEPREEPVRPEATVVPTEPRQENAKDNQDHQDSMIGVPVDTDKGRLEFAPSNPTEEENTVPGDIHEEAPEETPEEMPTEEHTHTHDQTVSGNHSGWTAAVVIGVGVVLIGGAVLYLKKR